MVVGDMRTDGGCGGVGEGGGRGGYKDVKDQITLVYKYWMMVQEPL